MKTKGTGRIKTGTATSEHAKKTSGQKNINLGSSAKGNDEMLGKRQRGNTASRTGGDRNGL